MLARGDAAPDFELQDQDGEPVKLSSLRGRRVVLYFYPKADTPGCTKQACGVRDHMPDYDGLDAAVLGAYDKQGLNFRLLADEDHAVAEERATFIIDPDGTVSHVIPKVSPKTHDEEVLAVLRGDG